MQKVYDMSDTTLANNNRLNKNSDIKIIRKKIILPEMSDFLANCPSVVREKIYRYLSVSNQQRLYRAYKNTELAPIVAEFKYYRQPISCWLCVTNLWIESFWDSANSNNKETGGIQFGALRPEPSHNTLGFKLLYTFKERNSFHEREVYRLRDFRNLEDTKPADKILHDFISQAEEVFKARCVSELQDHINFAHDGIGNFPEKFFLPLIDHEGELMKIKKLIDFI